MKQIQKDLLRRVLTVVLAVAAAVAIVAVAKWLI